MDITKKEFGENISNYRTQRGLTQAQLAEKANLSLRMVQHLEYGETFAGASTLERLSGALGVPVSELFVSKRDATFKSITETANFLSKMASLPPEPQKLLFAIATGDASFLDGISKDSRRLLADLLKSLGIKPVG